MPALQQSKLDFGDLCDVVYDLHQVKMQSEKVFGHFISYFEKQKWGQEEMNQVQPQRVARMLRAVAISYGNCSNQYWIAHVDRYL